MAIKKPSVPLPKVSVLVPCYNVEKYVGQCINSILCQTLEDIEIICIDDGSTDRTGEILDGYARLDGRMRVIHKENGGYGKAMNTGLDEARGEYIGIIESDDLCDPEMFATLYGICSRYNLDMAKSDFNYYWSKDCRTEVMQLFLPQQYEQIVSPHKIPELCYAMPCIWSAIYKRKMILDYDIRFTETPGASYQDTAFAHKIWCSAKSVWLVDKAFYWYRQDNESSSVHSSGKVYCVCTEYEEATKFAKKWNEKMLPFLEKCRYAAYKWNYNRLEGKYKKDFAGKMKYDFNKTVDAGYLRKSLFTDKEYEDYINITKENNIDFIKSLINKFMRA